MLVAEHPMVLSLKIQPAPIVALLPFLGFAWVGSLDMLYLLPCKTSNRPVCERFLWRFLCGSSSPIREEWGSVSTRLSQYSIHVLPPMLVSSALGVSEQ